MEKINGNSQTAAGGCGFAKDAGDSGYTQDPIAVIGMACRLPGESNSPRALWDFLERGGIASNSVPKTRFNVKSHYVGTHKPNTMRSPGGMYIETIDPQDFDAPFFGISRADAITMDPQQRQLLEVVYEGLENAGITLESLDGQPVACFVGSYAVDYADMHTRDPEDRPLGVAVGVGRAILSNRISHFLNIKGPRHVKLNNYKHHSATIDTACSASLQGVDIACRYLQSREITGAIVAGANIILSPEHSMDSGNLKSAHSLSGRCHTFDRKADGYIKAEAVNAVILKRLDDALRDGDSIRAVIRGIATNSDGRTPGIVSPSSDAQAAAIRSAYANAGISDYSITSYLECHGTGTQAGDPIEVKGAASVFAPTRPKEMPLRIGSIKSNVGHSEPAAGISGLLKTILSIEKGIIPGNPTFEDPNPEIDFDNLRVRPSKATTPWPDVPYRRASVNCFGYGGSNAHVIVDEFASFLGRAPHAHVSSYISSEDDLFIEEDIDTRPVVLVISANDEKSLRAYCNLLSNHLINPSVRIKLNDLAYTLSQRRTRHFHRAYVVTQDPTKLDQNELVFGRKGHGVPKVGFVFTGQGAQWPQMGKALVDTFPSAKRLIKRLDVVLQSLADRPPWSLLDELTEPRKPQHLRQPEFSQPLVTALQLVILEIVQNWGIKPRAVVGHSSGEIAAAYAAGLLTQEEAIKVAYYRGRAAVLDEAKTSLGMLAVGLGSDEVQEYIEDLYPSVQIGCFNSLNSVTLSGSLDGLETAKSRLDKDTHFARLLQVNLAYHSKFMADIAECYEDLLQQTCEFQTATHIDGKPTMYSSVTGYKLDQACDAAYWRRNMVSPVRFDRVVQDMLSAPEGPDFLIEIGPSGALSGPITQIKDMLPATGQVLDIQYCATLNRGEDAIKSLFAVAGRLFISGGDIDLAKVNRDENDLSEQQPRIIVDLPNYAWNHSTKYWHENDASKDWRFRLFPHHDLLGGKVLGTSWHSPSYRKTLRLKELPWLRDHRMGSDCLLPATGFISMAIEALYQSRSTLDSEINVSAADQLCYRLRNIKFDKALVLEEDVDSKVMLNLTPHPGPKDTWYDFKISSTNQDIWTEHCTGMIRLEKPFTEVASSEELAPLKHPKTAPAWYKANGGIGYGFGPAFQKQIAVEVVAGSPDCRSHVSLTYPPSTFTQSLYPMHPACLDGCFQTVTPSLWHGDRSGVDTVVVPRIIDDLVINKMTSRPEYGVVVATSKYSGRGRIEEKRNWHSNLSVYDPETGALLLKLTALRYHKLDTGIEIGAGHTLMRSMWKPDITFLSQDQLTHLSGDNSSSNLQQIIDLIAHKKPTLKVMEVELNSTTTPSIWFSEIDAESRPSRASYSTYSFATAQASILVAAQDAFSQFRSSKFILLDIMASDFASDELGYDLVIVKSRTLTEELLEPVMRNVRGLLIDGGYLIFVEKSPIVTDSGSGQDDVVFINGRDALDIGRVASIAEEQNFYRTTTVSCGTCTSVHLFVAKPTSIKPPTSRELVVASLTQQLSLVTEIKPILEQAGWHIIEYGNSIKDIKQNSTVLIQDECFSSVLTSISKGQWESLKYLVSQGCQILWVTQGSQMNVTVPDNALVHGMFRTIRQEDPSQRLITLDVELSSGLSTVSAIVNVLERFGETLSKTFVDNEFVERDGIIYINRIVPDKLVNQTKQDESRGGPQPIVRSLREAEEVANLRAERLGSIDALQYAGVSATQLPVADGYVEVEVIAAGLNFKDIIVTHGVIPENEHLLGLEGAGIVTRVGKYTGKYKVGDRVAMMIKPTFANRIQCPVQYMHLIPDWLSFEEAATIPLVYLTSMYCLFNIGNLQKGQSILIHSAAGGVGIACIYLAQYIGAEIYVTVSSEDKRSFLKETFGIPENRMFSSRTTNFARGITAATKGKGVDLIINSLTGELLDESWRICADGGTMVEIGKKDTVDRHSLSMEPFDRNCSFRAVDISYKQVSGSVIASLMTRCFELLQAGHIKPITPVKTFGFDSIPAAFAYMRNGRHMGKVIITDGENGITSRVPIRPAMRVLSLRNDVSYIIVGGLKGLCGSLAVHLASNGAKYIIAMSRSGISDERSQGIVKDCSSLGCNVQEAKADVSKLEDVEQAFKQATMPIGGIVQGAMVLRDKPFENMTVEEYHTTISNKVQGTWNLHNTALSHKSPISFFTLLSSISGVIGQKGQANYAAANAFLDAFASYRNRLGLPANSLDLGVIEDVGYVAEQDGMQQRFDERLWTGINEKMLRRVFNYSIFQQTQPIESDSKDQLVTGISAPQPDDSDLARDARFGTLFMYNSTSAGHGGAKGADDNAKAAQAFLLMHRSNAEKGALVAAASELLNKQFMKTLRLAEPMEPARSLSAYGLDSLSAVEVRNWVRSELGAELTTLDVTNASSLFGLSEKLITKMSTVV